MRCDVTITNCLCSVVRQTKWSNKAYMKLEEWEADLTNHWLYFVFKKAAQRRDIHNFTRHYSFTFERCTILLTKIFSESRRCVCVCVWNKVMLFAWRYTCKSLRVAPWLTHMPPWKSNIPSSFVKEFGGISNTLIYHQESLPFNLYNSTAGRVEKMEGDSRHWFNHDNRRYIYLTRVWLCWAMRQMPVSHPWAELRRRDTRASQLWPEAIRIY